MYTCELRSPFDASMLRGDDSMMNDWIRQSRSVDNKSVTVISISTDSDWVFSQLRRVCQVEIYNFCLFSFYMEDRFGFDIMLNSPIVRFVAVLLCSLMCRLKLRKALWVSLAHLNVFKTNMEIFCIRHRILFLLYIVHRPSSSFYYHRLLRPYRSKEVDCSKKSLFCDCIADYVHHHNMSNTNSSEIFREWNLFCVWDFDTTTGVIVMGYQTVFDSD